MQEIVVLDTETTGVANHSVLGHPEVIELAYVRLHPTISEIWVDHPYGQEVDDRKIKEWVAHKVDKCVSIFRYNPEMPIHDEAYKLHGILKKDLLGLPSSSTCKLDINTDYIIGHNISFDARCLGMTTRFAGEYKTKQICTMALAKALNKKFNLGITSFKLDNLNVHFYGEDARSVIQRYHEAATDVLKTLLLLIKLVEYIPNVKTFEELYNMQELLKSAKGKGK